MSVTLLATAAEISIAPDLGDLRGLALLLNGASEFTPQGKTKPVVFNLSAAVFFKNRSF